MASTKRISFRAKSLYKCMLPSSSMTRLRDLFVMSQDLTYPGTFGICMVVLCMIPVSFLILLLQALICIASKCKSFLTELASEEIFCNALGGTPQPELLPATLFLLFSLYTSFLAVCPPAALLLSDLSLLLQPSCS